MGTFHQGKHELHGITVVVDTDGPEVYVGRCDDVNPGGIILHDADVHVDGQEGRSKAEYVSNASRFGVWPKHRLLVVDGSRVISVRRLGELS